MAFKQFDPRKQFNIKINGKSATIGGPTPAALELEKLLKSIPNNEYYTLDWVGAKLSKSNSAIAQLVRAFDALLGKYTTLIPGDPVKGQSSATRMSVFGNEKSIKTLQKKLETILTEENIIETRSSR